MNATNDNTKGNDMNKKPIATAHAKTLKAKYPIVDRFHEEVIIEWTREGKDVLSHTCRLFNSTILRSLLRAKAVTEHERDQAKAIRCELRYRAKHGLD